MEDDLSELRRSLGTSKPKQQVSWAAACSQSVS